MNNLLKICSAGVLLGTAFGVSADKFSKTSDRGGVPERWECKYCAFEENSGHKGEVEVGAGYVSEDSYKLGDYTGQDAKGAHFVGGVESKYRDEQGNYWEAQARNLGLESRELQIGTGKQGRFGLSFGYSELPKLYQDTTVTPFSGIETERLVLPESWVAAGSTAGMSALDSSLQEVDVDHKRRKFDLGLFFLPKRNKETYTVNYSREEKKGIRVVGGSFGVDDAFSSTTSLLLEPIDYVTDIVEVAVSYANKSWQAKLGYLGSFFKNENDALIWQNPFADATSATGFGRLSAPPDNQFHQVYFSGGYELFDRTRATLYASAGKSLQDEKFQPYTNNASLSTSSLPRDSLDGEVDKYSMRFAIASNPFTKMRVNASYSHDEQDNQTPLAGYDYVITDTQLSTVTRTNLPYGYEKRKASVDASYRVTKSTKLSTGFTHEENERTFQEVDETKEDSYWVKARMKFHRMFEATLKAQHNQREGSEYRVVNEFVLPENPLLRKYNLADRDRDQIKTYFIDFAYGSLIFWNGFELCAG